METVYLCEFVHPKYGEQHTDRKTVEDITKWASYMVAYHDIQDIRFFRCERTKKEQIFPKIPKW